MTTTADVLWDHVRRADLCPGATSLDAWLNVRWLRTRIRGKAVAVLPVIGFRRVLVLHDVHHALTGYTTQLRGEYELAAWELASGGCGWHLPFWVDRAVAALLGFVVCPKRTLAAVRRGRRCRNLFTHEVGDILARDIDDVRREVFARQPE